MPSEPEGFDRGLSRVIYWLEPTRFGVLGVVIGRAISIGRRSVPLAETLGAVILRHPRGFDIEAPMVEIALEGR